MPERSSSPPTIDSWAVLFLAPLVMAYITQSDLEDFFGVTNIAVWSNLENDSEEADTDRIARAIEYAEAEVNDRFRQSMYAVPFSASSTGGLRPVQSWCVALAAAWLFRPRLMRAGNQSDAGPLVIGQAKAAQEQMDEYLAGTRKLNCTIKAYQTDAPEVVG